MGGELPGEVGVRPLVDFVDPLDIPLADFLSVGQEGLLDAIMVSDAWTSLESNAFVLGADFYLGGVSGLHLPGLDQLALSFNPDSSATGFLVCSDDPSLTLEEVEVVLEIDANLLCAADGSGAKIAASCGLRFDREGFHFLSLDETSLPRSRIAGTAVELTLTGINLDPGGEPFLSIRQGSLELPMFSDAGGRPLTLTGRNMSYGRDGLGGTFEIAGGVPPTFEIYGFACEVDEASIRIDNGQFASSQISGRIDLSAFIEDDRSDGWVGVTFHIGRDGISAAISPDAPLIELDVDAMFHLSVNTLRLEGGENGDAGTLWLSGSLLPYVSGVEGDWPQFAFNEIGVGPHGGLRLGEGASIAAGQPFTVRWNFLRLTVTAFSLGRPKDEPGGLELRISAGAQVLQGIPAGASVDGLVARRHADGTVDIRFDGIGIEFGTPGAFAAKVAISWNEASKALSGNGHLDVPSLDIRFDVVFDSRSELTVAEPGKPSVRVTTLFLAAEATLFPGGIPIGATGLSLYGVSGLLAYNLKIHLTSGAPRRHFDAFMSPEIGFASRQKWDAAADHFALGLGVVVGTGDDGWAFSCRGALLLSIPDLTLLLTATGELIKERQEMQSPDEGKLSALLAVYPSQKLLRADFTAQWNSDPLFDVEGSGGGEFHFDDPLRWSVWLGKAPGKGKPVSARALRLASSWLITAEYWFGIDSARSANIGLSSQFELRAGGGGIFAEVVGRIGADVVLSWNPAQLEGEGGISARARLSAGITISFELSSNPSVVLAKPMQVEVPLRACISIDLGFDTIEICLHYTFAWRNSDRPTLPAMFHGLSASPRLWNPRAPVVPDPDHPLDGGIVTRSMADRDRVLDLGLVQPHSELVLEFEKSQVVDLPAANTAKLNDIATPFPQAIGSRSGWLGKWSMDDLELFDATERRLTDIFGTFQRSTVEREDGGRTVSPRPPNTQLRLLSSRRYGQDGSLGGGGVENTPPVDCTPRPATVTRCVDLVGLSLGVGTLSNGWTYEWRGPLEDSRRDNRYGVGLSIEDSFKVWPREGITSLDVTLAPYQPRQPPQPGSEYHSVVVVGGPVRLGDARNMVLGLCWDELVAADGSGGVQDWTGSSGGEEWTLDAERRLLVPRHEYELRVSTASQLASGTSIIGVPETDRRVYRFTADRAPSWADALSRAVAAVYPGNGQRPSFRSYDFIVRFEDDFLHALYALDRRDLGVRLTDANGQPIVDANGDPVLLPTQWLDGPIHRSPAETWWGQSRASDSGDGCDAGNPPAETGETTIAISVVDLALKPETPYFAELVAVDQGGGAANPTAALARWNFTTSRYQTFTEMMTAPARVPSFGLVQVDAPASDRFDDLIRSFAAPPVAVVERCRIVPVRREGDLAYVLIEAPEPLDDRYGRLKVFVDNAQAALSANLDSTRIIARLAAPRRLGLPTDTTLVRLVWDAALANPPPEARRAVRGKATAEVRDWTVPLEGLF